jgi:branched-subunit amino acid transport protein|tara:strand:- start:233 stop:556 length:324 start_codon:yes stop_codon:yes gene_type:complete
MTGSVLITILVTSFATYLSRFLGVLSAEKIKETSKIFRWFNCLAYSTLAALIARIVIFPSGTLSEVDYLVRLIVVILSIIVFYLTKKNIVYPTLFSAIILALFSSYI